MFVDAKLYLFPHATSCKVSSWVTFPKHVKETHSASYLVCADLSGADLRDAELVRADLSAANLIGARLAGARFLGARLKDTLFDNLDLSDALDLASDRLAEASIGPGTITPSALTRRIGERAN